MSAACVIVVTVAVLAGVYLYVRSIEPKGDFLDDDWWRGL